MLNSGVLELHVTTNARRVFFRATKLLPKQHALLDSSRTSRSTLTMLYRLALGKYGSLIPEVTSPKSTTNVPEHAKLQPKLKMEGRDSCKLKHRSE